MKTPREAAAALETFRKGVPVAVLRGLRKGLLVAQGLCVTRFMERKGNRGQDPANPPPGPLGIRQGNLARTVKVMDIGFDGRRLRGGLQAGGPDVLYAGLHEFGGVTGRKSGRFMMQARPYMRPALEAADIASHIATELYRLARATLRGIAIIPATA